MILTLWLALLALGFGICLLGYFTDDEPYLTVGLAILFLLGIAILSNQLEYQTGDAKNVTFSYANSTLTSQTEVTAFTYTSWTGNTAKIVGFLLSALSGVGIALSLRNTKKTGAEE